MGYTDYAWMALVPPGSGLTFEATAVAIRDHLAQKGDPPMVVIGANRLKVQRDGWELRICWEDEPHVLEESREMARHLAQDRADAELIASCSARITTAADPDPDMLYSNDFAFVLEVLESIQGIYIFDPTDGKFVG